MGDGSHARPGSHAMTQRRSPATVSEGCSLCAFQSSRCIWPRSRVEERTSQRLRRAHRHDRMPPNHLPGVFLVDRTSSFLFLGPTGLLASCPHLQHRLLARRGSCVSRRVVRSGGPVHALPSFRRFRCPGPSSPVGHGRASSGVPSFHSTGAKADKTLGCDPGHELLTLLGAWFPDPAPRFCLSERIGANAAQPPSGPPSRPAALETGRLRIALPRSWPWPARAVAPAGRFPSGARPTDRLHPRRTDPQCPPGFSPNGQGQSAGGRPIGPSPRSWPCMKQSVVFVPSCFNPRGASPSPFSGPSCPGHDADRTRR